MTRLRRSAEPREGGRLMMIMARASQFDHRRASTALPYPYPYRTPTPCSKDKGRARASPPSGRNWHAFGLGGGRSRPRAHMHATPVCRLHPPNLGAICHSRRPLPRQSPRALGVAAKWGTPPPPPQPAPAEMWGQCCYPQSSGAVPTDSILPQSKAAQSAVEAPDRIVTQPPALWRSLSHLGLRRCWCGSSTRSWNRAPPVLRTHDGTVAPPIR